MTDKIGTVRMERDIAIQAQKDMRKAYLTVKKERDTLYSVIQNTIDDYVDYGKLDIEYLKSALLQIDRNKR